MTQDAPRLAMRGDRYGHHLLYEEGTERLVAVVGGKDAALIVHRVNTWEQLRDALRQILYLSERSPAITAVARAALESAKEEV